MTIPENIRRAAERAAYAAYMLSGTPAQDDGVRALRDALEALGEPVEAQPTPGVPMAVLERLKGALDGYDPGRAMPTWTNVRQDDLMCVVAALEGTGDPDPRMGMPAPQETEDQDEPPAWIRINGCWVRVAAITVVKSGCMVVVGDEHYTVTPENFHRICGDIGVPVP